MATEVKIPALGESISSGILANWHVKSGDFVEQGQALFDLETDKITSEGTAEVSGRIELKAQEGDEVEIGAVVAVIDESAKGGGQPAEKDQEQAGQPEDKEAASASAGQHPPSVRRLAEESGINPDDIDGSGKGGRVTKADMLQAIETRAEKTGGKDSKADKAAGAGQPQPREAAPAGSGDSAARESRKRMSPLRRTIAQRLVKAQHETAMLTTFNEVDMSEVMRYRKVHQDSFVKKHGIKLGFMSFFTKAVVHALQAWPALNGRIDGDDIVTQHYHDIGIAVSTPKGLLVPVVRDCDRKSFPEIEQAIAGYAQRAKEGKITIEDLQGGVFTITNGGVFGSLLSTPILNTPQPGILGMHTIQDRPVAVNGEVVIRPMMYLALSYDHRLVDGREAVGFLVSVKQAIEDPTRLLLDL